MGNGERKSNFHIIHHVRSWLVLFMTKRHIATVKMKISLSTTLGCLIKFGHINILYEFRTSNFHAHLEVCVISH